MKPILVVFAVAVLALACGKAPTPAPPVVQPTLVPVPVIVVTAVPTFNPGPVIEPTKAKPTNRVCLRGTGPGSYSGRCAASPTCRDDGGGAYYGTACYDPSP